MYLVFHPNIMALGNGMAENSLFWDTLFTFGAVLYMYLVVYALSSQLQFSWP